MLRAGRYSVVFKCLDRPVRILHRFGALAEAGIALNAFLRGTSRPADLEWSALYDGEQGGAIEPYSPALVLCIFSRGAPPTVAAEPTDLQMLA